MEWFGCGLAVSKTTTDAVPQRSAHAKNGEFQDCEELVFGLRVARLCFPILFLPLLAPRVAFFLNSLLRPSACGNLLSAVSGEAGGAARLFGRETTPAPAVGSPPPT